VTRTFPDGWTRHALALASLACGGLALAQTPTPGLGEAQKTAAQAAPPSFPAGVEQVVVDLVVTDGKGKPVAGLTPSDLVVSEDGVRQSIASFEAVELPESPDEPAPAALAAPPPPRVSTNADSGAQRSRAFVLLFDNLNMTPFRARDAKGAVVSFLERGVRAGDYVTLIATGDATWWTARMNKGRDELVGIVKRLDGRLQPDVSSERMSDWEAMRIHLHRDPAVIARVLRRYEMYGVQHATREFDLNQPFYDSIENPYVTAKATELYFQATARINATLEILERALNGLASAKGRKSVILVSEGFIDDTNLQRFKRVHEASRRANAAVYFVNARGLEGMPSAFTAQFGPPLDNQDIGFALAESFEAVGGSRTSPPTPAASPSRTPTTSTPGSSGSPMKRGSSTCWATSPRTRRATEASGRSKSACVTPRVAGCARAGATTLPRPRARRRLCRRSAEWTRHSRPRSTRRGSRAGSRCG
jgi:VWFA-related protein